MKNFSNENEEVKYYLKKLRNFIALMKKKYSNSYFDFDAVDSAAMEGIMLAIRSSDKYNTSYIMSYIENTVLKYKKREYWGSRTKTITRFSDSDYRDNGEYEEDTTPPIIRRVSFLNFIEKKQNLMSNDIRLSLETAYKEIDSLDEREKTIIMELIENDKTLEEVASIVGVTAQRVHQIYNEVIKKIKSRVEYALQ